MQRKTVILEQLTYQIASHTTQQLPSLCSSKIHPNKEAVPGPFLYTAVEPHC